MGGPLSIERRIPVTVLCLIATSFQDIPAQTTQSIHVAERMLMETIRRDKTSRLTCNLKGFFLSKPHEELLGRLILLKDGKRTLLIREASDRVYEIMPSPQGSILRRLDSSHQYGDNFRSIGFIRKDTLYQYGGYGFWRTRDFFSRFDPGKGKWEFVPSQRAIPGEYRMHHYDKSEDGFYMVGGEITNNLLYDAFPTSDSIYRYLFREGTWRSIGLIKEEHRDAVKRSFDPENVDFVQTDFGVVFMSDPLILFDFKGNRVMKAAAEMADGTKRIRKGRLSSYPWQTLLYHMGDSLHMIMTKNGNAEHMAVPLTESDFDPTTSTALYDASVMPERVPSVTMAAIAAVAAIGSSIVYIWRRRRDGRPTKTPEIGISEEVIADPSTISSTDSPYEGFKEKAMRFLKALNPTERELLREIMALSLEGKSMDIDFFNRSIGVAHKEDGVKKTRRSLTISKINEMFTLTLEEDPDLLIRIQDPDDRRSYRYVVATEYLTTLQAVFDAMNPGDA